MSIWDIPHCVYFLYQGQRLLYVGCSRVPEKRLKSHWPRFGKQIKMRVVRWYKDSLIAQRWESYYIEKHKPPHNIQYNRDRMDRREARKIWRQRNLTMKEALALMPGWKEFAARERLGRRP